ncbi:MAG TPA: hydrogen gas-evolving membrane-bound hydrogenase subunit E [Coriobacteriia bacterium]|nr:hydrogen gas-evolving membrane-bound hydrogenase subunit E [Coriobacteriia bacterium]
MKKAATAALLIVTAIPMLIGVAALPRHGDPQAPVHTGVSARYLEGGAAEGGTPNIVANILLNYRGLDTAGEVIVIFTALVAGLAALLTAPPLFTRARRMPPAARAASAPPVSPVVGFVVRLLAPFIALFAIYIIVHGHASPGGGFQGGAILGGLFVVLTIVLGEERALTLMPRAAAPWMQAAAVIAFVAVGVIGAALTGYFLGFPVETMHLAAKLMMIALEAGIGLGGAAIFATLFLEMETA